jgi:hypothetical protein
MIASHSAARQRPSRRLLVSLASTALLASGCSNMVNTAPSSVNTASVKWGGRVHGGNQPVAFATVNLYFAGQTTQQFGSGATMVATTTSADDGAGSFSFTRLPDGGPNTGTTNSFSCPTSGGTPYVYLLARGGNTLNTHNNAVTNPASVFLAPLGLCSSVSASTFVSMSEAVTAATVAAVHQYMNVNTGGIGSDSILSSYNGLTNSFSLVSNMVNLSTGQTIASSTRTGNAGGVTVTATPEQAKLNQIANILSACVNTPTGANGSSGTTQNACDVLFANAVPPASASTTSTPGVAFSAATDVLQAAYYMFTNPTDLNATNLGKLYALSPATGAPYQPTLTAAPTDWSIGIRYAASGSCGTGTNVLIASPYDLNVDLNGNIWIANNQGPSNSIAEITATGVPQVCQAIGGASHGGTIDSAGNVWVGDYQNNIVYRFNSSGQQLLAFPTTTAPFAMAADGVGNVYYSSFNPGTVWKISGAAATTVAVAPVQISTNVGTSPYRIAVDGNSAIWASSQDVFVSIITPSTAAGNVGGYLTTPFTTPTPSYGISVTSGGNNSGTATNGIYISSQGTSSQVDFLTGSGTNYAMFSGFPTASNAAGLNVPSAIAIDGAQNVWAANDQPAASPNLGVVSELSSSGTSLSADGATNGGYQKDPLSLLHGRAIAVDQSGNVWIARDASNSVTEIVGGGVPIYQPFSIGLQQGRFQTKP